MGRHRAFDVEEAVVKATKLFWRGYEQTSLTDLTDALGIKPASLYFAFGSKEALFRQVVDRYVQVRDEAFDRAFRGRAPAVGVETMLRSYVDVLTNPEHAPGCLLVNNSLSTVDGDPLQRWLAEHRRTFRTKLEERFLADLADGHMPEGFDPKAIAAFVTTVAGGLAVEAKLGAEQDELYVMVDFAMETLAARLQSRATSEGKGDKRKKVRVSHGS
jgi:AcrR family transcriptional regulator